MNEAESAARRIEHARVRQHQMPRCSGTSSNQRRVEVEMGGSRAKDEIVDEATTAEVPNGQTMGLTGQVDFETRVSSDQHVYHQTAEGLQT